MNRSTCDGVNSSGAEPISTSHRLKCAISCRCPAAERAEYPSIDNSSRKPAAYACSGPDTHTRDGDGLFMITPPPPEHPAPAKDSINPNGRPDYAEDPHHCEPPDQTQRPSTRHNPGLGIFSSMPNSA